VGWGGGVLVLHLLLLPPLITSDLRIKRAQRDTECLQRREGPLHIHGKIILSYSTELLEKERKKKMSETSEEKVYVVVQILTCNKTAFCSSGSTSWKFLTDAMVTRPLKLRT
jgi:hypothetical protein